MAADLDELLDPEIREGLGGFPAFALTADILPAMRMAVPPAEPLGDDVVRTDEIIAGPGGDLRIRLHRPAGAEGPRPCVLDIHGGGLVVGSVEMADVSFARWCAELGIMGASVDYRLAPEHPYPAASDDCYRALEWLFDDAERLGVDTGCVGVHGTSAGGGLAAALALRARDAGGPRIAFQLLDCPMLDDRQCTPSSQLDGLAVWSRESNTFGWKSYLGGRYGGDVPYTAAPARAEDLTGLPPAFVSVASVDGFLDEDVDYAVRLNRAGVPCELHVYPGGCHGYQMFPASRLARQSWRDKTAWLTHQIATYRGEA